MGCFFFVSRGWSTSTLCDGGGLHVGGSVYVNDLLPASGPVLGGSEVTFYGETQYTFTPTACDVQIYSSEAGEKTQPYSY